MSRRLLVIEHGTLSRADPVPMTQWTTSTAPFVPTPTQGQSAKRVSAIAQANCTICGAVFRYEQTWQPTTRRNSALCVGGSIVLFIICSRFAGLWAMALLLVTCAALLVFLRSISKPQEPQLLQISGPVRFKHRIAEYN